MRSVPDIMSYKWEYEVALDKNTDYDPVILSMWCRDNFPEDETIRWVYVFGNKWRFRYEEDAVAFKLTWEL